MAKVLSFVELVSCLASPPDTGIVETLKIPLLLLWNRIDFSSEENEAPPIRVVPMNCSMVYCFTAPASGGCGDELFFGAGVCFVIKALSDTSGFCSVEGFCAMAGEIATAEERVA